MSDFPRILTIHLKRYVLLIMYFWQKLCWINNQACHDSTHLSLLSFTCNCYRFEGNGRKLANKCLYPQHLDFFKKTYSLYAIIHHIGSAGSGHYVCVAMHGGLYYEFNDSIVSILFFIRSIFNQPVHPHQILFLLFPSVGEEVDFSAPQRAIPALLQAGGAGAKPEEARRDTPDSGKLK